MNPTFRLSLLFFVSFLLSACETAPKSIKPDVAQRVKRVAVVSTVGDVFTRTYIGITVFGNEHEVRKVPEWRIDRTYEEQLAVELRRRPGMTVVDAAYPAAAFALVNGEGDPEWKAIAAAVKTHCAANALDGVFVLAKGYRSHGVAVFASRHPQRHGAGISLSANLALLDCATAAPLAVRRPFTGINENNYPLPPSMPLPESWPWYGKWEPQIYDEAGAALVKLGASAWGPTLTAMMTPTK